MQLRRILSVTSLALVSIALAPLAAAQTPPKSPPQQPPKAATPRELFERAAYAEEHEHDFEKALAGFAAAEEAAKKAGDAKLAAEARTAHARVLARQGKGPAPQSASEEVSAQAQRLVAEGSALKPDDERIQGILADLRIFGRSVVPLLLQVLVSSENRIVLDDVVVTANPGFGARALSALDAPEATEALLLGLDSRDPLVRKAVIEHAGSAQRHQAVWQKAIGDGVPEIRRIAVQRLATLGEQAPRGTMVEFARAGDWSAVQWLAQYDPDSALRLMETGEIPQSALRKRILDGGAWTNATPELVARLGRWRRDADGDVREAAERALSNLISKAGRPIPPAVATAFAREVAASPTAQAIEALRPLPADSGFDAALDAVSAAEGALDPRIEQAWSGVLSRWAGGNPPPIAADRWLELYLAARRWNGPAASAQGPNVLDSAVQGLVNSGDTPQTRPVRWKWFESLGPAEKEQFSWALANMLGQRVTALQQANRDRTEPERLDPALLPWIEVVLASKNPDHRSNGWTAIGFVDDPMSFERCLEASAQDPNASNAAEWLARRHPEHASAVLEARIRASFGAASGSTRDVEAIRWLPDEHQLGAVRRLLSDIREGPFRTRLLRQLVRIQGPEATRLIQELYASIDPRESGLRSECIHRFANDLWEPAIPLLGEALVDHDQNVRTAAQNASAKFKAHREALEEFEAWTQASREARTSIDELRALLASDEREVVLGAVKALGVVKARTALPELVKLLGREDPELRKAVQEAIDKIGQ